jgi:hypothetical protein
MAARGNIPVDFDNLMLEDIWRRAERMEDSGDEGKCLVSKLTKIVVIMARRQYVTPEMCERQRTENWRGRFAAGLGFGLSISIPFTVLLLKLIGN